MANLKEVQVIKLPKELDNGRENHLYFTSDEEIKEGDWVMYNNCIEQAGRVESQIAYHGFKKIIASTDPKLIADGVAQIPQAFIQKYVELGGIYNVMVEYFEDNDNLQYNEFGEHAPYRVKVNSNNEITIHPIKDSWSREEVLELKRRADAIIVQASDVLGTEYNTEYKEYFDWSNKHL